MKEDKLWVRRVGLLCSRTEHDQAGHGKGEPVDDGGQAHVVGGRPLEGRNDLSLIAVNLDHRNVNVR